MNPKDVALQAQMAQQAFAQLPPDWVDQCRAAAEAAGPALEAARAVEAVAGQGGAMQAALEAADARDREMAQIMECIQGPKGFESIHEAGMAKLNFINDIPSLRIQEDLMSKLDPVGRMLPEFNALEELESKLDPGGFSKLDAYEQLVAKFEPMHGFPKLQWQQDAWSGFAAEVAGWKSAFGNFDDLANRASDLLDGPGRHLAETLAAERSLRGHFGFDLDARDRLSILASTGVLKTGLLGPVMSVLSPSGSPDFAGHLFWKSPHDEDAAPAVGLIHDHGAEPGQGSATVPFKGPGTVVCAACRDRFELRGTMFSMASIAELIKSALDGTPSIPICSRCQSDLYQGDAAAFMDRLLSTNLQRKTGVLLHLVHSAPTSEESTTPPPELRLVEYEVAGGDDSDDD